MSISYSDCLSDLLCGEDSNSIFGEVSVECSSDLDSQSPDIEESIAGLIEDERDFVENFHSTTEYLDASTRAEYVAWIIKVQKYYAFQPLTTYLSVNYFDRFLHSRRLPKTNGWPLQLLSVACLSLAAKMEEVLVPPLLNLQVEGAKIIFEPRNIQRMELLVLRVLDWRLRTISPFNYLNFFANKIDPTGTYTMFITSRAIEIILSNIQEASFLDYRPSCIAAATILCAANDLPNFSFVTAQNADSWCGGLHIDKINGCYRLMRQIVMNNRPRKPPKVLPHFLVMPRTSMSSDSSLSSSSSSFSYKRRKLNNGLWMDDDKGCSN
ncbi:cyclin-D1-1 [Olea europaea subsp. europaea]|uniref:Cyclin-D1-1 n=1 Tax=Olea europaea subsp. europaea TaxID=158383 RepID=A0A8S0V5K7_OLEEU|nr:cyclin-D1-1 [Olea europaea subsp. europaea]